MPPEPLAAMLRQAEQSEPSVRAAALLRIARVVAKTDQAEAERLLDRGLERLAELPEEESAAIATQATYLAACIAPDRAFALRAGNTDPFADEKFLFDNDIEVDQPVEPPLSGEALDPWKGAWTSFALDMQFPHRGRAANRFQGVVHARASRVRPRYGPQAPQCRTARVLAVDTILPGDP